MRTVVLSLAGALLPLTLPAQAPAGTAALAKCLNEFAVDLHAQLAGGDNPPCSPASISLALLMLLEGTAGTTRDELVAALHLPEALRGKAVRTAVATLLRETVRDREEAKLTVVDDIWAQQGSRILDEYAQALREAFGAPVRRVDFVKDTAGARQTINAHIAKATNERIAELLPPDLVTPDTRVILTNAMWFKARWEEPFHEGQLEFHVGANETAKVPGMWVGNGFAFAESAELTWVRVPYSDRSFAMDFVLPAAGQTLASAEKALLASAVTLKEEALSLRLPKFTVKAKHRLRPVLEALGVRAAFTTDADLSPINGVREGPEKLVVDEVVHEAWVQVDEKGTEAAAATAVVMKRTGAPANVKKVVFDRPFAFAIRDVKTGLVLFVGRVTDPRAK